VLCCDKDAMILVFINLISNAIKYSRIRTSSRIAIGCFDDEFFYKFYIKDNGIGFRAKDRGRVFLLFSRLRNKRNVSGTGVGLAIVKKIVIGHGGEIWVESRMNQGSTFYFTLPKHAK
jgi:signal transduction histidine kinase